MDSERIGRENIADELLAGRREGTKQDGKLKGEVRAGRMAQMRRGCHKEGP